VALCVLTLLGCGQRQRAEASADPSATAATFPVRVKDDLGRSVLLPKEPKRIVTLLPSHTETLFALGVGSRVIGVDDYSDFPADVVRLPKLGGMYDARVEGVLGLSPDLVFISETSPATSTMERVGLTVWAGSARTLDDVYRVARICGDLTGRTEEAAALVRRIHDDLERETRRAASLPRVRVYYELDATPYAVGPDSFVGALLAKAGGDNVVPRGIGEWPKVSPEVIATADPEVVIGVDLDALARRPGWDRTTAVRNRRVFSLTPEQRAVVVRSGPRIAEGVRVLSQLLHPEAVK
jgi:iron complex transport system substrate-binding protein